MSLAGTLADDTSLDFLPGLRLGGYEVGVSRAAVGLVVPMVLIHEHFQVGIQCSDKTRTICPHPNCPGVVFWLCKTFVVGYIVAATFEALILHTV